MQKILNVGLPLQKAEQRMVMFSITGMDLLNFILTTPPQKPFKYPTTTDEALELILRQGLPPGVTKRWADQFQLTPEDILDFLASNARRRR